jgi:hypothetical protein
LLVSWCAGDRCGMHVMMGIVTGVGDMVQRTGNALRGRVLGGRAIERSGGAVCGLHCVHGDEKREFFS